MSRLNSVAQALLRGTWFGVIPALLAGLCFEYLMPALDGGSSGALGFLALLRDEHAIELAVAIFLAFVIVIRYWRFHLPWGFYLAQLPLRLASRLPRSELAQFEAAQELREWLRKKRTQAALDGLITDELRAELERFEQAFKSRSLDALRSAEDAIRRLAAPLLRRREAVRMASFGLTLGVAAAAALLLRTTFLQNYRVLGSSMLPSFERGDELYVNRRAYRGKGGPSLPGRGEVIVFHSREAGDVVKRVIGLPGDTVQMRGRITIINGWRVPACDVGRYVHLTSEEALDGRVLMEFLGDKAYLAFYTAEGRPFPGYEVKPGEVFLLGDNRNDSLDSRTWRSGQPSGLPLADIQGRVERILWSPLRNGEVDGASLFKPLGFQLNADGIDTSELEGGIRRCLSERPAETTPPAATAAAKLTQSGVVQ